MANAASITAERATGKALTGVSVVVPCFNEVTALPTLIAALQRLAEEQRSLYRFELVFVDDCSDDGTGEYLEAVSAAKGLQTVRHSRNRGISAAIRTGMQQATEDIIAVLDADCSYDPRLLPQMIRLLEPDVDVVTASPYHPAGRVENVPAWRLAVSRELHSFIAGCSVTNFTHIRVAAGSTAAGG